MIIDVINKYVNDINMLYKYMIYAMYIILHIILCVFYAILIVNIKSHIIL